MMTTLSLFLLYTFLMFLVLVLAFSAGLPRTPRCRYCRTRENVALDLMPVPVCFPCYAVRFVSSQQEDDPEALIQTVVLHGRKDGGRL